MTHWGGLAGAAALVLCAAGAAAGNDRPVLRPLHDVDVTYQLDAGGGSLLHERLRWDVASQRLRVDPPTVGLYVIIDFVARRMSTVKLTERTVIEMAAPDNATGVPDGAAAASPRERAPPTLHPCRLPKAGKLTGKLTGNFANFGLVAPWLASNRRGILATYR